jgi:type II secretory pathway predicted ATPase ExeA
MYETFFGLRERAFDLSPNPRFMLLIPTHREALSNVEYGLTSRQAITLLIGEAGTGKTSVVRRALAARMGRIEPQTTCVYLNNPALTREEFIDYLAGSFSLGPAAAASKAVLLRELERYLKDRRLSGQRSALIIDEAQSLPEPLLEEIRLLANIELEDEKLLPLVLAGQPELADRLNQPSLRQLKQRVALRCTLATLTLHETGIYIAGRVRVAGGDPGRMFSRHAVVAIHQLSGGIPRLISVLCENALLTAFAADREQVDVGTVHAVARDFDLGVSSVPVDDDAPTPASARVQPFRSARDDAGSSRWPNVARHLSRLRPTP